MAKTYGYAVIYNGVFYPANTPIEETEREPEKTDKQEKEPVKKNVRRSSAKS